MRKCAVGGQAVMEGVMMKSEEGIAMAVRRADGKIVEATISKLRARRRAPSWGFLSCAALWRCLNPLQRA